MLQDTDFHMDICNRSSQTHLAKMTEWKSSNYRMNLPVYMFLQRAANSKIKKVRVALLVCDIQLTLAILTLVILNNRLSRSEILVPILT